MSSLINFTKAADLVFAKKTNISNAGVGFALDISGSMSHLYKSGVCQRLTTAMFALAMKLDDDQSLDFWLFSTKTKEMPAVTEAKHADYIRENVINVNDRDFWGITNYAPCHQQIMQQSETKSGLFSFLRGTSIDQHPRIVFMITDGDCSDPAEWGEMLQKYKNYPVFVQIVNIAGVEMASSSEMLRLYNPPNVGMVTVSPTAEPETLYETIITDQLIKWWANRTNG